MRYAVLFLVVLSSPTNAAQHPIASTAERELVTFKPGSVGVTLETLLKFLNQHMYEVVPEMFLKDVPAEE